MVVIYRLRWIGMRVMCSKSNPNMQSDSEIVLILNYCLFSGSKLKNIMVMGNKVELKPLLNVVTPPFLMCFNVNIKVHTAWHKYSSI